jgi:hypothetical protein
MAVPTGRNRQRDDQLRQMWSDAGIQVQVV